MEATEYEIRARCYRILDLPSILFTSKVVLGSIPKAEEELLLRREDLRASCASGIYKEFGVEEAREAVSLGRMVSSEFVIWQGEVVERNGRFVIKFSQQSRHEP
jgi:hypothetical protein